MTTRTWGTEYRLTTVCIDSYENRQLCGRFYHPCLSGGQRFHSVTQFLLGMQQALDAMDFPKAFTAIRNFTPPTDHETGPPDTAYTPGKQATFTVRILFRQNASWQGSVIWMEGRQEQCFRSVLELILLLDNALTLEKAS